MVDGRTVGERRAGRVDIAATTSLYVYTCINNSLGLKGAQVGLPVGVVVHLFAPVVRRPVGRNQTVRLCRQSWNREEETLPFRFIFEKTHRFDSVVVQGEKKKE